MPKEEEKLTREYASVVRVLPSDSQIKQFQKTFGCARFVYNHFLDMRKTLFQHTGAGMTYNAMSHVLTQSVKKEFLFLKEVDKFALENALRNLDNAYAHFFRRVKERNKPYGFPKFKNKRTARKSYTTQFTNNNIQLDTESNRIKLPKLGWMPFIGKLKKANKILNATVSQSPNGAYSVSVLFQESLDKPLNMKKTFTKTELTSLLNENQVIAGDLGIRMFLTCSNGVAVENPKWLDRRLVQLGNLQRQLSKKKRGSKNDQELQLKIAKLHCHIKNSRKDFHHKLSHALVKHHQLIILEKLNVKGMVKNKKLSRRIQDAGWSQFKTFLTYKALWQGKTVCLVDQWFPSSKLCSVCATTNKSLTLSDKTWVCPTCGAEHERDANASLNLLAEGLRLSLG